MEGGRLVPRPSPDLRPKAALATTSSSNSLSISLSVPVSISVSVIGIGIGIGIGHRSSVIRLNPQVSLGCASFGLRQPERHRYRSSKSMAETMDAVSIESGVIRIEWAKPGGGSVL
jgi:hypothetical protein